MSSKRDKFEESTMRTDKEEKHQPQTHRLAVGTVIFLLIVNIVLSATSVYVYDKYFAQRVAFVDIRGYLFDRKKLFLNGTISEKEFTESVDNIEKALKKVGKRTIVLQGDAVVRNAEKIDIDN